MSLVKSKRELADAVEHLVERVAQLERIIEEIEVYENEARLNALL
jgi:uncharacterized protein Yka (UPF0111/DUF47 family)